MAAPPRARLNAETAPDAEPWWKERIAPVLQAFLGDTQGALDHGLTLGENLACSVSTVRVQMPETGPDETLASARYTSSASTSVPTTTDTLIDYGNKTFDSHNAVTTGASWKFTVPAGQSGLYDVRATVLFAGGTATDAQMAIYKNGGSLGAMSGRKGITGGFSSIDGADTVQLVAGDHIDIRVSQLSGGPRSLHPDASFNHVNITRVYSGPLPYVAPSCFPVSFRATLRGKPFKPALVWPGNVRDADTGGAPTLSGPLGMPVWDWDGERVRLLDMAGLAYGHSYDITLVVFAG